MLQAAATAATSPVILYSSFISIHITHVRTNCETQTIGNPGSPGLVVMGGDSRSEGCGFESQCHILDGHDIFSHIFVVKICNVCLKRLKINEKEAGVGPFFKTIGTRTMKHLPICLKWCISGQSYKALYDRKLRLWRES